MKKLLIIIVVAAVGVGIWGVIALLSSAQKPTSNVGSAPLTGDAVRQEDTTTVPPSDIRIGILDSSETPSAATILLAEHLRGIGFRVDIIVGEPGPDEAAQEETTLRLREGIATRLESLKRHALITALYREVTVAGQQEDIVFGAWNIGDIKWGERAAEAERLMRPAPDTIAVIVRNAGAEPGSATAFVEVLAGAGYTQVETETVDEPASAPALVYHLRNYEAVARDIVQLLKDAGYGSASYRYRHVQDALVVIELGPSSEAPEATPAE